MDLDILLLSKAYFMYVCILEFPERSIAIPVICAVFTADAASRIKSTDLINFCLRVVNLDDKRRINGDQCVIFDESKFLLSFCEDKMSEN